MGGPGQVSGFRAARSNQGRRAIHDGLSTQPIKKGLEDSPLLVVWEGPVRGEDPRHAGPSQGPTRRERQPGSMPVNVDDIHGVDLSTQKPSEPDAPRNEEAPEKRGAGKAMHVDPVELLLSGPARL